MGNNLILVDRHTEIAKIIPDIVSKVALAEMNPTVQATDSVATSIIL
jgi:hypothetical protein